MHLICHAERWLRRGAKAPSKPGEGSSVELSLHLRQVQVSLPAVAQNDIIL